MFLFGGTCFGSATDQEKLFMQRLDSAVKATAEERFSEAEQICSRSAAAPLTDYSDTARFHFYYNRGNYWFQVRNLNAAAEATTLASVIDEGAGIPDKVIDAVFTASHVASTRGTAGEKGTGLGLTLIRDFAQAHGGTFTLERGVKTGTLARVSFPNGTRVS